MSAPTTQDRPARRKRPQLVLDVLSTQRLGPHLVRVWVGGENFAEFVDNGQSDHYVKIWFADPALGLQPPYDLDELRETVAAQQLPVTRTYTVRTVEAERLAIDFVVHGDEGLAGPWAASVQPGAKICFSGPGGAYTPDPEADAHLLIGDESALPAIASAIEALPADAVGNVFIEVYGADDELPLTAPPGIRVSWLHRGDAPAGTTSLLADAVAAHGKPEGRVQVFAHGEREAMKAIRDIVVKQWEIPRSDLSLSGYWAHGRSEDRFQAEKREPIGVIL